MPWKLDRPAKFVGSEEEARRNRESHRFIDDRCVNCDCRPWGRTVDYPCGTTPPREKIVMGLKTEEAR